PDRHPRHPGPRVARGRGARDRQGGLPRSPARRAGRRRRDERRHAARGAPRGGARDRHRRARRQARRTWRDDEGQAWASAPAHVHEGDAAVKLKDRIGLTQTPLAPVADDEPAAPPWANSPDRAYQDLKLRIHRLLLDRVDLANLAKMDLNQAEGELRAAI